MSDSKTPDVTKPGTLKLTAFRGENLKNRETFGKQDPYLVLKIGKQKQKTKTHFKGGKNPSWEETFVYELDGKYENLELGAWDEDTGADDEIGSAIIPLKDIVAGMGKEVACVIRGPKKGNKAGEIILSATYTVDRPGNLYITLSDAKGLPNKDIGKQDPYVKMTCDGKREKKSKTHNKGGSNPVWNQEFAYSLAGKEKYFMFKLYDEDTCGDDKIGECRVSVADLLKQGESSVYYKVTDNGKDAGELGLICRFVDQE